MVQGPRVLLKTWNPLLFFWSLFQKMFSSPLSLLVSFKLSLINILSKDFPSICFLSLTPPMKMFQFVDPIQAIFTEKDLSWDDLVGKKIEAPFKCGCLVVSRCFFFFQVFQASFHVTTQRGGILLHQINWCWGFCPSSNNPYEGYPQIINSNRVFHYKPSILGYHYFWKHPYVLLAATALATCHRYLSQKIIESWGPTCS